MTNIDRQITYRKGLLKDSDFVVPLIYSTGDYLFNHVFGGKQESIKILASLYKKRRGIFSHIFTTIAEYEGQPIGVELGYSGKQHFIHSIPNVLYIIMHAPFSNIIKIIWRNIHIQKISKRIPWKGYYIAHFAIHPDSQRKGFGKNMLTYVLRTTLSYGYKNCYLDVSKNNTAAINLYKKNGFHIQDKLDHNFLEKNYGLYGRYRMGKKIR